MNETKVEQVKENEEKIKRTINKYIKNDLNRSS